MIKISNKQYAEALYESLKSSKDNELKEKVANFLELLKKRKSLKRLNNIFKKFREIYQRAEGIIDVEIVSARQLDEEAKKEVNSWLKNQTKRDPEITEIVRPEILGGAILKYEDNIFDASLSGQLKKLKKQLNN